MFSIDGILYRIGTWLYRLLLLNLLFLLCCIPIITIPASVAALYVVTRKHNYKEEPPIPLEFFRGFRGNIKQSTAVGVPFFIFSLIWWLDLRALERSHTMVVGIAEMALILLEVILLSVFIHIFPIMVHMELSLKRLLLTAFKFTMIKPMLTLMNLAFLCAILYVAGFIPILYLTCFFSGFAAITYWIVDKKFRFVMTKHNNITSGVGPHGYTG